MLNKKMEGEIVRLCCSHHKVPITASSCISTLQLFEGTLFSDPQHAVLGKMQHVHDDGQGRVSESLPCVLV